MRTTEFVNSTSKLSPQTISSQQTPNVVVLTKVTAQELAMKVRTGQVGPLKACSYNPASNTLKVLSSV